MSVTSYATATALTAAGTAQGTALLLSGLVNVQQVSTCTTTNYGVRLPVTTAGLLQVIANNGVASLSVYPQTGGAINSLAVNLPIAVAAGLGISLTSLDGLNWISTNYSTAVPATSPAITTITATTTIAATTLSGIYNVASAVAAVSINLPTAAAGMSYEFYVTGALANAVTITATGALIKGQCIATNVTAVVGLNGTARTNIILSTGTVIGDRVTLRCIDGTNWIGLGLITTNTTLTVS
jgi:hypothetical protein